MRQLISRFLASEGLRATGLVAFGNVLSTGLGAVAMILIFRALTPGEFGLFSAVFAMMMVAVKLSDLGVNVALQRTLAQPDSHVGQADKQSIWTLTLIFKLAVAALLSFLGLVLAIPLSRLLHLDPSYLTLGLVATSGMIVYDQAVITSQALHRFALSVGISAFQSVVKIIGVIYLSRLALATPGNLVLLYGISPLIGSLPLPLFLTLPIGRVNWQKSTRAVLAIAKFTAIAVLSAALADNLDVIMIQSMLTTEGTGLYSAGARIASFVGIVGYAIGIVLNIRVAKYKTKEHLEKYLGKAHRLAALSFFSMLLTVPFASLLIRLTAGIEYLSAAPSLQLLLIAAGLVLATSPYVALFYTFDRPQYFAVSGILIAVLLLTGNWLLIPTLGIFGAGLAKLLTRLVIFIYTYRLANKLYHEEFG